MTANGVDQGRTQKRGCGRRGKEGEWGGVGEERGMRAQVEEDLNTPSPSFVRRMDSGCFQAPLATDGFYPLLA